jgi:hypothetical protein
MVFIHGIGAAPRVPTAPIPVMPLSASTAGVGLLPYIGLVDTLQQAGRGPLVLVELPFIALRVWSTVPSREGTVEAIRQALNDIGHESGLPSQIL